MLVVECRHNELIVVSLCPAKANREVSVIRDWKMGKVLALSD
jgi:hypothetical protein